MMECNETVNKRVTQHGKHAIKETRLVTDKSVTA
jgi:hypothetical protein